MTPEGTDNRKALPDANRRTASSVSQVDEDLHLGLALYRASHTVAQLYRPALVKLGVTFPQYLVLTALWQDDGCSMKRLGERLGLDSGTLSPLLKRLETSGYLERRPDKDDARRVTVHLLPPGEAARAEQGAIEGQIWTATGMSAADLVTLTRLASHLSA